MDLIEKELQKINFVVQQYVDEKQSVYELTIKTITEKLKKIIDELAVQHLLTSSNTIRKIKHYSFSSRVKDPESLKEKLIRNNLGNDFFSLLIDDFDNTNGALINEVKNKLVDIDDLMGIKILTDLNIDCKRMYDLVNSPEFASKATAQDIKLNEGDLKKQPQPMRNGLDIYKIKATYNRFNFELQIKSKIISAWGDMEHSILYKDYSVSPVRDTMQSSMNHVGKLLFEMDDFLESIRNTNKLYKQNAEVLNFLQWFDEKYNLKINKKIEDVGFRLDGISELLYAVYRHIGVNDDFAERELRFEHFEHASLNLRVADYIEKRNKIYDLKILESVVLSWMLPPEQIITEGNIDEVIQSYLQKLQNSTAAFLVLKNSAFESEEMLNMLTEFYEIGFNCDCNEKFLLSLNSLNIFFLIRSYLFDISESVLEAEYLNGIIKIVFVSLNKGSLSKIVEHLITQENLESDKIKTSLIMLKEQIDEGVNKLKIDLNKMIQAIIESIN